MKYCVTIFCWIISTSLCAQHVEPSLSEKHVQKIEGTESAALKLKKYKRYFHRDSMKCARQIDRFWKAQTDSIADAIAQREKALSQRATAVKDGVTSKVYNAVYKPWARKLARQQGEWLDEHEIKVSSTSAKILLSYFEGYFLTASQDENKLLALKQRMPDIPLPKQLSSKLDNYKILNPEKVSQLRQSANGKLKNLPGAGKIGGFNTKAQQYRGKIDEIQGSAQGYSGKLNEYGGYAKTFSNADSATGFVQDRGEEIASTYVSRLDGFSQLGEAQGELNKLKAIPGQYKSQIDQLQDSAYIKEQAKEKAEELAMNYVGEHPEIMQSVQKKMALLMKKYSIVPNSNDLSTAVKRTSLKGRRFRERLYFAGNFQVLTLEPVTIDFSPMAGYRFNARFLAGIGGNYRQSFRDSIPALAPTVFGYKVFSSYDVVRNFFAYAEFDRNSTGVGKTETGARRLWKDAAFLGIGRKVTIRHKIEMTVVMMYNFFHEHKDPIHPRAWSVRIGFQTSQLAMIKPKPAF